MWKPGTSINANSVGFERCSINCSFTEANAGENVVVDATTADVVTAADGATADVVASVIADVVNEFAEPDVNVEHQKPPLGEQSPRRHDSLT